MGAPGVGKTSFLSLMFNWPAPKHHHSTGISSVPTRAIERIKCIAGRDGGKVWVVIDGPILLKMLSEAISILDKTTQSISSVTSDQEFSSTDDPFISPPIFTNDIPQQSVINPDYDDDNSVSPTSPKAILPSVSMLTQSSIDRTAINNEDILCSSLAPDKSYYPEEMLQYMATGKTSDELYKATWVHVLDSGGQPQFSDVCRSFIRGNCVNIIVFKLTEDLDKAPCFLYSIDGQVVSEPSYLQLTNIQLIETFVRSIASAKYTTSNGREINPIFCIVGTCLDKVSSLKSKISRKKFESLKIKNTRLLSVLEEFREHFIFYNDRNEEIIFPVNNLCKINRQAISCHIRERLTGHKNAGVPVQIPIRWYLFEIKIREKAVKHDHGLIPVSYCLELGSKLAMSERDVKLCLSHLNSFNLLLYFDGVLPDLIFTNPQYLINMVSELISISFFSESSIPLHHHNIHANQYRTLRKSGLFDSQLLDLINLKFVSGLFSKKQFLKLLQHLLLVSRVQMSASSFYGFKPRLQDENLICYFIPSVLPSLAITKEDKAQLTQIYEPVIIAFRSQIVPQVFIVNFYYFNHHIHWHCPVLIIIV